MIIDCHTHIFPNEVRKNRNFFCEKEQAFSAIYRNPKARLVGVEDLIASMDETEVDASVICGFSWSRSDACRLHNQYLLESVSRYPLRLIAFLSLSLSDIDWSLRELENGVREGARGVGEIAFYGRLMTSQDLNLMRPILTVMEEKKMPLLLHTNETIGHAYPGKGKTPLERFYELALSYPKLPILLAHWGGGLLFYELMPEVAKALSHVYYDTAASPFLYSKKIYSLGCEIVGAGKILFGSDFPLMSPKRYVKEMEESGVKKEDQRKILGLNLFRLLGLDRHWCCFESGFRLED
jgi:predicted TIM-barrel fold metal-dependent hydrolase